MHDKIEVPNKSKKIAVLLHDLRGGGAERVMLRLANEFAKHGREVDLLLVRKEGAYLSEIPKNLNVITFNKRRVLLAIPAIARYLRHEKPDILLSGLNHINVAAVLAGSVAKQRTRVILTEHNQISKKASSARGLASRLTLRAVKLLYPSAHHIVAVSEGVAEDLRAFAAIKHDRGSVIYNPVVHDQLAVRAAEPVEHPWLQPGQPPVILGAGRLHPQKGFDVLLTAFARVRQQLDARLIIIGEGTERSALEALARGLGIQENVDLAGFVQNPYAYMSKCRLFVISSRWEGMPTVLIEAMACGASVISTDCPSGPDEILDGGRFAPLVPVDAPELLADAILDQMKATSQDLTQRASEYSAERSARRYLELFL